MGCPDLVDGLLGYVLPSFGNVCAHAAASCGIAACVTVC